MSRTTSVFKRGRKWWARIRHRGGPATQRSLETEDQQVAEHMGRFLDSLRANGGLRETRLLTQMAEGSVSVMDAYHAYVGRTLDLFMDQERFGTQDPELEPFIHEWMRELARRKMPTPGVRAKYERQVRTFITPGMRKSQLTRSAIRAWLTGLSERGVGQPNRYRAALSSFCQFLMLEDVMEFNPARQVPASSERPARDRHLTPDEAFRLVQAFHDPKDRAFQALLIISAADYESARGVCMSDFAPGKVFIRGTKKSWRRRYCHFYKRWDKLAQFLADYLKSQHGYIGADQPVFYDLGTYFQVNGRFHAACAAAGITDYSMKDHRHTWAVQAFKDRLSIHAIYQQLGHKDGTMALKVYGKYAVREEDYRMGEAPAAQGVA